MLLRSINRSGCFVLPTVQVTAFIVYSRPFRLLRLNKLFKLGGPRPVPAAGGVKRAQGCGRREARTNEPLDTIFTHHEVLTFDEARGLSGLGAKLAEVSDPGSVLS